MTEYRRITGATQTAHDSLCTRQIITDSYIVESEPSPASSLHLWLGVESPPPICRISQPLVCPDLWLPPRTSAPEPPRTLSISKNGVASSTSVLRDPQHCNPIRTRPRISLYTFTPRGAPELRTLASIITVGTTAGPPLKVYTAVSTCAYLLPMRCLRSGCSCGLF